MTCFQTLAEACLHTVCLSEGSELWTAVGVSGICFLDNLNDVASRKIPSCKWPPPFLSIAELSAPGSELVECSVFSTLLGLLWCVSRRPAALTDRRALLVSLCLFQFGNIMAKVRNPL